MKHLQAIKAKLKAQHPGLPEAILDRVANALAKTASEEATDEDLTNAVANQKELVTSLADFAQKEGDRRVTEAIAKKAKESTAANPAAPAASDQDKSTEEVPDWAKGLIQAVTAIAQKDAAKTHGESLQGLLKDKVPPSFYGIAVKGRQFKDADEVNAFASDIEAQYGQFQQEQANGKLAGQTPPGAGGNPPAGSKEVSADIKAFVAKSAAKPASV